jgi:2-polyprenyl-6-methoxyphenol hydroxylase-like FAD-dependent oxidoreductase
MQETLLALAHESGAEVRRGIAVAGVQPGTPPVMELEDGKRVAARLVVGADGRTSRARGWAGLPTLHDPECLVIAGIFHGGLDVPEDAVHMVYEPRRGQGMLIFPVGGERFRSYFFYARQGPPRPLHGARHADDFVAACVETGAPPGWFVRARVLGPLAAFEACDRWVERPHREGVVLIGDAAAATDPTFGDGLSLTLRDVRTLRDRLLGTSDWQEAAEAYAVEHARYYGALRRIQGWTRELLFERGAAGDARRARALPLLAKEPDRRLDYPVWGPEAPSDDAARRRFYGED